MGSPIRYLVPYQVDIVAKDLSTNKRIGNTLYYITNPQSVAPPAYGANIAGPSDTATLLASIEAAWTTLVLAVLSDKYAAVTMTMQAIVGYGYGTPFQAVSALVVGGTSTTIQTSSPHGLASGDFVRITGVTGTTGVNGTWPVLVLNSSQFTIPYNTAGVWTGGGSVQAARGRQNFIYADKETLVSAAVGGLSGDALPIFADVDVRRLNAGVGKSFRSRIAMAPVAESQNDFGKLTTGAMTTWTTALAAFNVGLVNGGSDATSGYSYNSVVSRLQASMQPSPFTYSSGWSFYCTSMAQHANLGSQNNRKPKLAGT